MNYPGCLGNWTNCPAERERFCVYAHLCYKTEEEKVDAAEG